MYSYSERSDYFDIRNQLNSKAIKIKVLNELGNFVPLNNINISRTIGAGGFSMSKGADADDMARMNPRSVKAASKLAILVSVIDSWKINLIRLEIQRNILGYKAYSSITYEKPALFIALIQRNKLDKSIAIINEVQLIDRGERQRIISKAKRLKKDNQLCLQGKTSCLSKASRVNDSVYYENLFILVTR